MKINKFKNIFLGTFIILCVLVLNGCTATFPTRLPGTTSPLPVTATPKATITPLPVISTDSLQLVYEDDFNNPNSGWSKSSNAYATFAYTNGGYNISIGGSSGIWYCSNDAAGAQDNFVVNVDTALLSSVDNSVYGIIFRYIDNNNYYALQITGDHYSIYKEIQGKASWLQHSTESPCIMTDGSENNLEIACLGKNIEVYVNGQRLTTLNDDSLTNGKIELMAAVTNTSVNFDNFKVYKFTGTYITKADPEIPVINTSSLPDGEMGANYNAVLTASGGTPPYSWELAGGTLPEGLSLLNSNGTIAGTPTMQGKYDFTIKVSSSTGETTQEMQINVSDLTISTDSLTEGIMHVGYKQVLQASGGKPPYTWSIVSGSVPGGLELDAVSGAITGSPTQSGGPTTAVFQVVDSAGASATEGLSITVKLEDFQALDQYAIDAPASAETTIQALVNYLIQPCANDAEKARVIYRWITQNIDYDVPTFISGLYKTANCPDQSAEAVFTRRNAVCAGYSNLFLKMAGYAGLQAVKIGGWGRVDYTDKGYTKDHDWNAVKINGQWQLVDTTWGAGYTDDSEHFVRSFDDFWFLTPPSQFVYSHCPDDASWQLLTPPVPVAEIAQYPIIKSNYFKYGLNFGDYNYGFCNVNNGEGLICIQAPPDVLVMASLFQNNSELQNTVFYQRQGNSYQINILLPSAGDYELRIYAKWKTESGNYDEAIIYKLTTNQSVYNQSGFPTVYSLFCTSGSYLFSPMRADLQIGASYDFKIMVPGAKKVALFINPNTPSQVMQLFTKEGQIFEGTFNITEGTIFIGVMFPDDTQYYWLLEYVSESG